MKMSQSRIHSKYLINIMDIIISGIVSYKIMHNGFFIVIMIGLLWISKEIKRRFDTDFNIMRQHVINRYKLSIFIFIFSYIFSLFLICNGIHLGFLVNWIYIFYDYKFNHGLIMEFNIIKIWFRGDDIEYDGKIYRVIQKMRIKGVIFYRVKVNNHFFVWTDDRIIFREGKLKESLAREVLRAIR
jgi:hypothetical protein